jgi:hypothetical protein
MLVERLLATGTMLLRMPTITFAGRIAAISLPVVAAWLPAAAIEISGAGATFPYPIFSQ